jgi:hypothetical protein
VRRIVWRWGLSGLVHLMLVHPVHSLGSQDSLSHPNGPEARNQDSCSYRSPDTNVASDNPLNTQRDGGQNWGRADSKCHHC